MKISNFFFLKGWEAGSEVQVRALSTLKWRIKSSRSGRRDGAEGKDVCLAAWRPEFKS